MTTPAGYTPGRSYKVTLRGNGVGTTITVIADPQGRLHIDVPLGPGNPYQQDTAPGILAGTHVYTTIVGIG
ncbi:MAG: hypothetical protein E6J14_13895 [Chloroflexi bacterium]|nr:MAG: hypothetical protein E6J14_13895 [Chloroflexota bacterium]